jgi:hypothetical protein
MSTKTLQPNEARQLFSAEMRWVRGALANAIAAAEDAAEEAVLAGTVEWDGEPVDGDIIAKALSTTRGAVLWELHKLWGGGS